MNELKHLAIIMDGNGRWAKAHFKERSKGHQMGAKVVEEICIFAAKSKIKNLSLYAFSTENWKRPKSEVEFLMQLLHKFLLEKSQMIMENNIKFNTIGNISVFDKNLQISINNLKELSKNNNGLNLILALNYGSRDEIVRSVNFLIQNKQEISENNINNALDTKEFGDVDLLIRTGGEKRLSNFLLWQLCYAELAFTSTLWPDFTAQECEEICENFKYIKRRFGGI